MTYRENARNKQERQAEVAKKSLSDGFEKIGVWRFPDSENEICGRIIYDLHDGILLQTICPQTDSFDELCSPTCKIECVQGTIETGERVLLLDAFCRSEHSTNAIKKSTYRVERMFVGKDFPNKKLEFDKISIQYTSLYTWLSPQPIKIIRNTKAITDTTFTHIPPKDIEINLADDFSLQIIYGYRISGPTRKNFVISHSASVNLVTKKALLVDELYGKINYFRNFLMLATDTKIQEKSIKFRKDNNSVAAFLDHRTYESVVEEQDFLKLNFNYLQIKETFGDIIRDWFDFSAKYNKSADLYFRTLLEDNYLTIEIKFLRICQSLEVFHRIKFQKKNAGLKCSILDLKNTLDKLDLDGDFDKFAYSAVTARNYYSHGSLKNLKSDPPSLSEIVPMTYKLDLLMFACIVKETKLPEKLKTEIICEKKKRVEEIRHIWD